jgi:hypothetical protein
MYYELEWDGSKAGFQEDEPSEYLYETNGRIVCIRENDTREVAGEFRVCYADLAGAFNNGVSPFDVLDVEQETSAFYSLLDPEDDHEFSSKVTKVLDAELFDMNVLMIHYLSILPEFRGRRLGLAVLRKLMERFQTGAGVVALKPFPLQFLDSHGEESDWDKKLKLKSLAKDKRTAERKLRSYYSRLGFKSVPGTDLMVRDTTRKIPALDELQHDL